MHKETTALLLAAAGLANLVVGGKWNQQAGVGFKAAYSSPLAAVRLYEINKNPVGHPGYMGGTGGKFKYELYNDYQGIPGSFIASSVEQLDPQYPQWLNNGGFPLIVFPSTPVLVAGTQYHLVVTNEDADPINNYKSLDFLYQPNGNTDPNSFVEFRPAGSSWRQINYMAASPVAFIYADGNIQGNGGYEVVNQKTLCGEEYGFFQALCQ